MTVDSSFFDQPNSSFLDDETLAQKLAKILSPTDSATLTAPPPTTPPKTEPGQSTPQTGSLLYAPTQAQPKISGPPMLPGRAALPENIRPVTQASAGGLSTVQPVQQASLQGNAVKPAKPVQKLDNRTVAVRDMNGNPLGSGPRLAMQGGGAQPLATQGASPVSPMQTQATPYAQLKAQQGTLSPVPAVNPDPGGFLRPGGSNPAMPTLPAPAQQTVNAPSQLDQDQAQLSKLTNSGSGIDQIKNKWGRGFARAGDIALRALAPGIEPLIPGTQGRNQFLVGQQQQRVANDQAQQQAAAQLSDTQSQIDERQALANKADRYDPNATHTVTTADGVFGFNPQTAKYDQKIGDAPDKLNKYQIITAGDGTMFRVDPADPTHAEPITGPDGKQLSGKQESKYIQLQRGGEEHTIEIGAGGKQTDLGPTGQKPMHVSVSGGGTWALEEDKAGKPVLFNSKTGETKDAPDIQKAGTAGKAQAAIEKANEPVDAAMNYASDYVNNGHFTGSGDEALQEKFFELAKPSVGFRMTQPQIDLLQNSRSWMSSAAAHLRHATKGTWFSDDQRKEIVDTMKNLAASKKKTGGQSAAAPTAPGSAAGGFNWGNHPEVQP